MKFLDVDGSIHGPEEQGLENNINIYLNKYVKLKIYLFIIIFIKYGV